MQRIDIANEQVQSGYLVLEPANLDPENFAEFPAKPCSHPLLTNAESAAPRLVQLGSLTPAQQALAKASVSAETADLSPPVICAWIDTPLDGDALARHLARFLVGAGPDGEHRLWRYYDPRVFALAVSLYSTEKMEALLGPVLRWRFPWCQRWWCIDGRGEEVAPLLGHAPAWPDDAQWKVLEDSPIVARVLRQLACRQDDALTDEACQRAQREIVKALAEGRQRLGMSSRDDLAEYALHCARYGDAFRGYYKIELEWQAMAEGRIVWTDVLSQLGPSDYRKMDEERRYRMKGESRQ